MYLYHLFGRHESTEAIRRVMKNGLHSKTTSMFLGCGGGGGLFPGLIHRIQKGNVDKYLDFEQAVEAKFSPYNFKKYVYFPAFTKRIYVFDKEITTDLFTYIEDEYMREFEGKGIIEPGFPSKEELMQKYWKSKVHIDDYLDNKPYQNPEVLVFESIPASLLESSLN
ncbi:hypothetical protein SAMN05192534_1523 [Alteribacillus persepolensis]|uniref:Uncharacterized protein n=1 Tax=Alteribacillus persepolensis TaxID=568899 RepID=A0A1G8KJF2_9BACI|nr:hypothetical protein [Alteribacillus persepolensis]SDI43534.1 hypothetical protein SAMN05192534_1523 [Alteribacillus persepolensis]